MDLTPIVTELRRQVTKLENWLRRLEDNLRDDETMPQATVKGRALTAGNGVWQNLSVAELQALVGSTDFVMGDGFRIQTDEIRALDVDGLEILDDGGNLGILVADGGTLQIGANAPLTGFQGAGQVQINKTTTGTMLLHRESADANGVTLELLKRRSGWGVVSDGDRVGTIMFGAADSVDAAPVAQIHATVDGAPGSNDMPGRLVFSTTADGTNAVVEAMRITSAQRIGLGNNAPLYPVHVGAGADTLVRTETALAVQIVGNATITTRNTSSDIEATLIAGTGSAAMGAATNHGLGLLTNNTARINILSTGEVGIGTAAPAGSLHVDGTLYLERDSTALTFYKTGTGARNKIFSDTNNDLTLEARRHWVWQDETPTEFMRLTSTGGLGINTNDPQQRLHVVGTIALERDTANAIQWYAGTAARNKMYCDTSNNQFFNSFAAWIWETNTPTELMRLTTTGRLGISDPSPDGMLDVIQPDTTAAIPVIELEQLDLSEEFFNFVGTVATGNPIEAVGAKVLTTTHFVRVAHNGTLKYFPIGTIA